MRTIFLKMMSGMRKNLNIYFLEPSLHVFCDAAILCKKSLNFKFVFTLIISYYMIVLGMKRLFHTTL